MGLDSYLCIRFTDENGEKDYRKPDNLVFPDVNLCGGMLSGNGNDGSFRGKVYDEFIDDISGVSLYQEVMPDEDLRTIASALEETIASDVREGIFDHDGYDITGQELRDLAKLFRFAVDNGLTYIGWW